MKQLCALIVEDQEDDLELLLNHLKRENYEVTYQRVETPEEMTRALEESTWDMVLSDYSMPRFSAPEALRLLRGKNSELPFIIISGTVGEETAVEAMRAGAQDFFVKGKFSRLVPAIERELRDVKVRKRLKESEEMFRQSQKMEAFGHLAGGVAHDFNNILAVILICSDSLISRFSKTGERYKELEQIRQASKRAANLTRQLLAFSRKQVLDPKVLDLNEIVRRMGEMLQRMIKENVQLSLDLEPRLNPMKVDPGQMEQVIMNLAINASQAMPEGGTLTLRTKNVEVDEESTNLGIPPGDYIRISAQDTGCGMDQEIIGRIFDPFFTTKGPNMGTGLGLSTVYGIVKQSGGFIKVFSKKAAGTTFDIYLPKVDLPFDSEKKKVSLHDEGKEPRRAKILLVEDDMDLRSALCLNLEDGGHKVFSMASPEEAMDFIRKRQESFDLVITDLVMPGMSGTELVKEIKKFHQDVKVLYISGYTHTSQDELSQQSKDIHFLLKPFSSLALLEKVKAVLATAPIDRK